MKDKDMIRCLFLILVFVLVGCDEDKPSKEYRNLGLSAYEDEVRLITPYTAIDGISRSKIPGTAEEGCYEYLLEWGAWEPVVGTFEQTIFDKLFDPGNGVENIYGPVQILDQIIEQVNQHSSLFDNLVETVDGEGEDAATFSVLSIETIPVKVPFFGGQVSVDRIVKYDDGKGKIEHIAFTINEQNEKETLVAFSAADSDGPLQMVIYGERDNETNMVIKVAVHLVYNDSYPSHDSFKGQFIWRGNLDDDWFSITQKTDAANGNWEVIGGGSIAAGKEMAFMSRNNDGCPGWYYIKSITNEQIITGTKPGDPISVAVDPPDGNTKALRYITDNNTEFPGILENYPTSEITCDWCTDSE